MTKPPTDAALEARKRESVAQLLFKCARLVNERAMSKVNELPQAIPLRTSHTNLFPHLDFEGVRITELARRLDISKQAVSQTIAELELMDVVETIPDPADGRARLARFTDKGKLAIMQGLGVLRGLETEIEHAIGKPKFNALHDALLALESMLDSPPR
jgi:MarR family transcriptional regulator, temperature-dependent positive regulator of motility